MTEERETWANKVEVFLSVLGYIIGLGNIWRFPYMAFENGGGAFLIPYVLCACVIGFPLFFLETALGQFMKRGAVDSWNIMPIMKGVGLGSFMIAAYCNLYYIVVMAWGILYFFVTITTGTTLPWMTCDNWWNSHTCMPYDGIRGGDMANGTTNFTTPSSPVAPLNGSEKSTLSVMEFWDGYVLRKSSGLEEMGTLQNWPLLLSYICAWVICYFCTFKGVKSTGKVVYFTATFPYVILLVLLVRGCTLPGAMEGITYYLKPDLQKLASPQVWVDAASQIIYSYGICFAALVTFASFNEFHHDCLKHTAKLVTACSLTSFVTGLAVFTVVGNLAQMQNVTIDELPLSGSIFPNIGVIVGYAGASCIFPMAMVGGPGLVFLAFPTALSLMPLPNLWNALFFFMIIIIGIDSQFTGMEAVMTVISDKWPNAFTKKYRREMLVGVMTIVYMIMGIPFVMEGGIYLFELFNNYAVSGIALLWLATMESIAIGHMYGADRFCDDVELMIGYKPPLYFKICIKAVVPLLTASIVLFYVVQYSPLEVDGYTYSSEAEAFGWLLCMSSFLCVPGYAALVVWQTNAKGFKQKIREAMTPIYSSHIEAYRETKRREKSDEELKELVCDSKKEELIKVENGQDLNENTHLKEEMS